MPIPKLEERNLNRVTHLLLPRSRVLPEKLKHPNLLKKFPAFYWTRRFITAFTRARHVSLSWARLIQSMPPHPTSRRSILILSSHLRLGLSSGHLPSGFPTKALYAPLLSPIRATCLCHAIGLLIFSIVKLVAFTVKTTASWLISAWKLLDSHNFGASPLYSQSSHWWHTSPTER
jgi:hypothetical protein